MFNNPDTQKYESIQDVPLVAQPSDRLMPRQVGTGVARGQQQMGTTSVITNNSAGRIEVNISNVPQIFLGALPDGTYGLVVSKTGIDVNTLFT
jgi:hypothetical protein